MTPLAQRKWRLYASKMKTNARLSAAAPEMLAALKHAIALADENLEKHFTGRTGECAKAYAMCAAAIAKAEGKS